MSYTIYKSTSGLIAQPGRSVSTFPSGLVRVEQTFLAESSAEIAARASIKVGDDAPGSDSAPAVDGLKIFPEVQFRRREDGFTEFIVTSYGRSNLSGTAVLGGRLVTLFAGYTYTNNSQFFAWTIKEDWLVDTYTVARTMLASELNSAISITPPTLGKVLKKREIKGTPPPLNANDHPYLNLNSLPVNWTAGLESIDRRNFGYFDEVTIVYKLNGSV